LVDQETVRVSWPGRPQWTGQEPDELEQCRPVSSHRTVRTTSADCGEQVLVHQFLLEILTLLAGRQTPRSIQRPHHRQPHDHPRSPNPIADQQYGESLRIPDRLSSIIESTACRVWPGQTSFFHQTEAKELQGVPVGELDLSDD